MDSKGSLRPGIFEQMNPEISPSPVSSMPSVASPSGTPIGKSPLRYVLDVLPHERSVDMTISVWSDEEYRGHEKLKSAFLAAFNFLDAEGAMLVPEGNLAVSKLIGPYTYLELDPGNTATTRVPLEIPNGCAAIEVKVCAWSGDLSARLIEGPQVVRSDDAVIAEPETDQIDRLIEVASSSVGLIMLYTTAPTMGHTSLGLRPNRLAREYAKKGWAVVFFPFGSVKPEEVRYQNEIFQFSRADLFPIMERVAKKLKETEVVFICSSFADINAIAAMDFSRSHGWKTLYEVRDEMEEFNRVGYSVWYKTRLEAYVARNVDNITTVSPALKMKLRALGADGSICSVIPNAVESTLIEKSGPLRQLRLNGRDGTKVGYIGHLTPSWFDWQIVIDAARQMPDVEFEIIGHGAPANIQLPYNLVNLGPRTHDEFLELSASWKVGLIPFKASRLTRAVDPNKLFEYLAVGLRVVSAEMGSVDSSPGTFVYTKSEEFVGLINKALNTNMSAELMNSIEQYLSESKWSDRASQTLAWIGCKS